MLSLRVRSAMMQAMTSNLDAVRSHFSAGRAVCPFAATAPVRYAADTDRLEPLFHGLARRTAAVIVATTTPKGFRETHTWARETFMAALAAATAVSHPTFVGPARDEVFAAVRAALYDDSGPSRPMIGLRDRPLATICMAGLYPVTHPRYAPAAALVLIHHEDADGMPLPAVRRAMLAEHGSVYDANELMLPLPSFPR